MKTYNYVYRLTHKATNMYYVGSRASNLPPEQDLGIRYFTSSAIVKPIYKESPHEFTCKVLQVFPTYLRACRYEHKLLNKCQVPFNPRFYNRSCLDHRGVVTQTGIIVPSRGVYLCIVKMFANARMIKNRRLPGTKRPRIRKDPRAQVWKGNTARALSGWRDGLS